MEINTSFIAQTAKDYDLQYETVLSIYEKVGIDRLYAELEKLIENRKTDF